MEENVEKKWKIIDFIDNINLNLVISNLINYSQVKR